MRGGARGIAVVVLLCLDALLLAWGEMAWLSLRIGAVELPVSAVVALVTTPLLVVLAGIVRPTLWAPFSPLVVWTLTVLVAGLWSPAGAGVLPLDWRAILLIAAGVLPGMLAMSGRRPPAAAGEPG